VFDDLSKRYPDRTSGYLRTTHLARRVGDSAPLMLLELAPAVEEKKAETESEAAPRRRRLGLPRRREKASSETTKSESKAEKAESAPAKKRAPAEESFHARFSATGRTYEYRIRTTAVRDPLWTRREHWQPVELDVAAMRVAAAQLVGRHDFGAFAAGESGERTVTRAEWISEGSVLRFEIDA